MKACSDVNILELSVVLRSSPKFECSSEFPKHWIGNVAAMVGHKHDAWLFEGRCPTLARGGQDRIMYQVCLRMLVSIRQFGFINTILTRAQDPSSKPRNVSAASFYYGKLVRRRVILRTAVLRMDFFWGSGFSEIIGKAKTS